MQQFDEMYDKITKKYVKHEIHRLSKRKNNRKIEIGTKGRHFKLDVKNRFFMLLVYYRLYITYTLDGFLFNLDQGNVCTDIQKIENMIRKCISIPQKLYKITKRLQTPEEVEKYFPGFMAFIDSTEQQMPRPIDNNKRKPFYPDKKKIYTIKTQLMVNNQGIIIHKLGHKKGRRKHDYDIYKKNSLSYQKCC